MQAYVVETYKILKGLEHKAYFCSFTKTKHFPKAFVQPEPVVLKRCSNLKQPS